MKAELKLYIDLTKRKRPPPFLASKEPEVVLLLLTGDSKTNSLILQVPNVPES